MIGIIDAELISGKNHRFPNLACMKISAFHKGRGDHVNLLTEYRQARSHYQKIYVSSVFTEVAKKIPPEILKSDCVTSVQYGGTGFYYDKFDSSPMLEPEIEHIKPDYELYSSWVYNMEQKGVSKSSLKYYKEYSIGFLTRGCPRKCPFCVNKNSKGAKIHSPIEEFYDESRKKLCLLDDNFLALPHEEKVSSLNKLIDFAKSKKSYFEFKQGLDIRFMTESIAELFGIARYSGDFIFAFDQLKDSDQIDKRTAIFRKHVPKKGVKFYVFCAYDSQDAADIKTVFDRIQVLWKHKCLAYVMRYEKYLDADEPYRGIYIQLARWCNQPNLQKKLPFREFCIRSGKNVAATLEAFEERHPEMKGYADLVYPWAKSSFIKPVNFGLHC